MSNNFDANRTALLIMDVQSSIVARYPNETETFFSRIVKLADAARTAGVKVIYAVVSFRAGHPEIGSRNLSFSQLKESGRLVNEKVHPAVTPRTGEVVVEKRRVSAFSGSDLEVILRGHDINHLILTGISTSGVVLSTLRQAADADYELTVVSDCCLDFDDEVHSVLMNKVFPRQARVTTADSLAASFTATTA